MLTLEENQGERHGTHSETDEDLMVEELFLHVDSWRGFRDRLGATWGSFLFHPHVQGSIIPKLPEPVLCVAASKALGLFVLPCTWPLTHHPSPARSRSSYVVPGFKSTGNRPSVLRQNAPPCLRSRCLTTPHLLPSFTHALLPGAPSPPAFLGDGVCQAGFCS